MAKDTIFKFRISDELLDKVRERAANISEYLRDLIRADINQHPEELRDLPKTPYTYHARLINVIDGDTLELDIDVGFSTSRQDKVRLARINSPEIDTSAGKKAKKFIQQRLQNSYIVIETRRREKFGRYLALVYYHATHSDYNAILTYGTLLNDELIERGHAKPYA
jgi:micrococcal nuclease